MWSHNIPTSIHWPFLHDYIYNMEPRAGEESRLLQQVIHLCEVLV